VPQKIAVTEERLPAATEITFRGELADIML
jgi:hypothetical protein